MTNRITNKDIETLTRQLNEKHGHNVKPWNTETREANIGTFYVDSAYGGVKLVQIDSESGGVRSISPNGYGTKRELYTFLRGMLGA